MFSRLLAFLWPEPKGRHARTVPVPRSVRPDVRPVPIVDPVAVAPQARLVRGYYVAWENAR